MDKELLELNAKLQQKKNALRKKLKEKNIKDVKVVYSTEQAIKNDSNIETFGLFLSK